MGIKWFFRVFACILVLISSTAMAAEIHGRSSTQYLWFNDIFTEKKQAEIGEYLNVSITKLDQDNKLTIQGYGRGTYDFRDVEDGTDYLKGRLFYLYLDYRDLYDKIDLRIGRQFINYTAGSALVDGGQVELKNIGPVAFSAMGGRNVIFDLNGENSTHYDRVFGAAAYLRGFRSTDAEISYFSKRDKDGNALDQIGLSFKQYLFNSLKVYTSDRYDLPSETFNEVLVGAKYYPTADLIFTGERYESYPTFDYTSIYSVFAVNQYKENVFRADYIVNENISVNGGYSKQVYEDDANADVFEVGLRLRPIEKVQLTVNYDQRRGYGGKLNGGIAELSYEPTKELEVALGIHHDVYERDRITGRETASKYWVGGSYKLAKNMSASVRVEDDVNARFKNDWQGRVVFNYDF